MWGYGVKIFPDPELQNEIVVYEGQFVNGDFHGVGVLNSLENGNYLYGKFRNGKPTGKVLNYNSAEHDWFIIDEIQKGAVEEGKGFPPPKKDGYKTVIEKCMINNKKFIDEFFDYNRL